MKLLPSFAWQTVLLLISSFLQAHDVVISDNYSWHNKRSRLLSKMQRYAQADTRYLFLLLLFLRICVFHFARDTPVASLHAKFQRYACGLSNHDAMVVVRPVSH